MFYFKDFKFVKHLFFILEFISLNSTVSGKLKLKLIYLPQRNCVAFIVETGT